MRHSFILSGILVASLVFGCNNESGSGSIKTGYIGTDNDTTVDDNNVEVEQVPEVSGLGDSEVEEVPAAEGSDDSGEAEDTAVEEEPTCEYVTCTWDGDIALGNNLVVSLNSASPSGAVVPGKSDVLILDFEATDPDCSDILVTGFSLRTYWTDSAGTGWHPTWVGTSIDGELVDGVSVDGGVAGGTATYPPIDEQFIVRAGETVTVTFSAEMYDASAADDDSIVFGLYVGSLGVYDGENLVVLHNEEHDGNTLVF